MFSWKRQRKDGPEEPPRAAPLGCSTSAALGTKASLASSSGAGVAGDGLQPATPAAAGPSGRPSSSTSSGSSGSRFPDEAAPGSSIELAARGAGGEAEAAVAPLSEAALEPVLERASVRTKAAFFEALIHSNTTTHVVCTAEGAQHCSYGEAACCHPADSAALAALALAPREQAGSSALASTSGASASGGGGVQEGGGEGGYSEVHMVLRMPRGAPPRSARYGSVQDMEATIEALQRQLDLKEQQRKAAVDAYARRTGECENLMRVVRELTESRSKAVSQRASLAERYAELQAEYHRSLRIADLSRTVSKENMAKTSRTRSELRQVQLELHATKKDVRSLSEKHKKVRVENALLKEKVTLLERLDFEEAQESEVKKHHTRYRLVETY